MLKLERNSARSNEIVIRIRDRPIVLSRELLLAFGIAVFLHMLALTCFHIRVFKIRESEITLPTSIVLSEIPQIDSQAVAQVQEGERHRKYPMAPQFTTPSLPKFPDPQMNSQRLSIMEENLLSHQFLALEREWQTQPDPFKLHSSNSKPCCRVLVSGPLSEWNLQPFDLSDIGDFQTFGKQRFIVQVDAQTGSVFWYESLDKKSEIDPLLQDALAKLKFEPSPSQKSAFIAKGEIEFIVNTEGS